MALEKVRAYWDRRAMLGEQAGTQDLILHQIELDAISEYVEDGMNILDMGCGNGQSAFELAKRFPNVTICGVDFSPEMIKQARQAVTMGDQRIWFMVGDISAGLNYKGFIEGTVAEHLVYEGKFSPPYALAYTKRCLINLPDWEAQAKAIENICALLKPGGRYLMCEHTQNGLAYINHLRAYAGLPAIKAPWHNRYLRDKQVLDLADELMEKGIMLDAIEQTGDPYYFLSRVVNAAIAAEQGEEPQYDSPINQLAARLPPIGVRGQSAMWVWRKMY